MEVSTEEVSSATQIVGVPAKQGISAELEKVAAEQSDSAETALPMCVWLRGDGDADDFVMTAEEVMAELNIKRSRLTQISGRELRVGRKRVDRYIKPFYRQADVLAYRTWTRASATKQKNAELVDRAASDIENRNKRLLDKLQEQLKEHINTELLTAQRQILAACQHHNFVLQQQLQATQTQQTATLAAALPRLNNNFCTAIDKLSLLVQETQATQKKTAADNLASLVHLLQQQEQLLQSLYKTAAPQSDTLAALPKQIHKLLATDLQHLRDSAISSSTQKLQRASIAPQPSIPQPKQASISAEKRLGWCSINPTR